MLHPLLSNYSKNVITKVVELEESNEIASRELIKAKTNLASLEENLHKMNRDLQQERMLISNKSSEQMKNTVNKINDIRNMGKNYLIQKEKNRIRKYILENFNNSIKSSLDKNNDSLLNSFNKIIDA